MLFVLLVLVATVEGVFLPLYAYHKPQCFLTKRVSVGSTISGSYEVSGSTEEIVVSLQHPTTDVAVWTSRQSADHFKHFAAAEGQYNLCFKQTSNKGRQTISFQLHVTGDSDYYGDLGANLASKSQTERIGILTKEVESKVYELMDHQDFAITRETVHRGTTESTNSRVLWWSVAQVSVLITLSVVQMYYLKSFFEIKLIL